MLPEGLGAQEDGKVDADSKLDNKARMLLVSSMRRPSEQLSLGAGVGQA
eukprot:CAMPEP_0183599384 /NCGR_PEP_ID=MMETSP0371-20130417/179405_1 /TAXON_ID=268820 /ORGANISM="Peridinium aciculiferum, Strain PAER-2" /LENGTH=48 /DNA_ID= /DNA_START= /DNA_END= /DNA_ORIENTATION=